MGVVYQARHNQTGRLVALKLIVPETAAARSAVDRFLREMSVISQLKHPNIVEWLEQGMTRGQFWFAMEYVAGDEPRGRWPRPSPASYPIHQACRMACQVLKGLEQAHELGFVHRDIKPENILIGRQPEGLIAKISDFGLAKSFRGLGPLGPDLLGRDAGDGPVHAPRADARLQDRAPLGRPLRDRRDALLPAHLPVHLRPGGRGRRPDPDAPRRAPRPDPAAPAPTSPPGSPPSWRSASPATPRTATPPPPPCARRCGRSAEPDWQRPSTIRPSLPRSASGSVRRGLAAILERRQEFLRRPGRRRPPAAR